MTRDEHAIGRQRALTGKTFEAEIDMTIAHYRFRHWANVRRNHAPTRIVAKSGTPQRVLAKGGADVDRTGWVAVRKKLLGGPPYFEPAHWNAKQGGVSIVPVAFDCKVLGISALGLYTHDVERQHQLHALKNAAECGEFAFLLVLCPAMRTGNYTGAGVDTTERVFAIPILNHWTELISGRGVRLFERQGGRGTSELTHDDPCLPAIEKRDDVPGWDWLRLVEYAHPTP